MRGNKHFSQDLKVVQSKKKKKKWGLIEAILNQSASNNVEISYQYIFIPNWRKKNAIVWTMTFNFALIHSLYFLWSLICPNIWSFAIFALFPSCESVESGSHPAW